MKTYFAYDSFHVFFKIRGGIKYRDLFLSIPASFNGTALSGRCRAFVGEACWCEANWNAANWKVYR